MTLVKCKKCESEYESTLEVCPNCEAKNIDKSEGTNNNKIIKVCVVAAVVLIFAIVFGVGSKETLTCTKTEDGDYGKISSGIKATFKKDSITSATLVFEMTVDDREDLEEVYEGIKDEFNDLADGIKPTFTKKGRKITATLKANKNDLSKFDINTSYSKKEMKESFEHLGYTCK